LSIETDPNAGFTIAQIYSTNVPELRRFALNLARDADRAEDLVSDTVLKAMAHLSLLEQLNPYQRRAWLYRTLKNRFIDEQRSRKREQALLGQMALLEDGPVTYELPPDLLAQVPEQYHALLQMRFLLGMTSDEIGEKLGIPAATVRSRLHLAIKCLRQSSPNNQPF
jgi:RNA polymerase sigma-70 factor, ECF subfamily